MPALSHGLSYIDLEFLGRRHAIASALVQYNSASHSMASNPTAEQQLAQIGEPGLAATINHAQPTSGLCPFSGVSRRRCFLFNHLITMTTPNQTLEIEIARALAAKYHAGQMYGTEPYTVHLEQVAESVRRVSSDERLVIVAYLHDILEDTMCPSSVIADLFEDNVYRAVCDITRQEGEAKEIYLDRVKANHMAKTVKVHDSLCNLKASIARLDPKRIKKYADQIHYLTME